MLDFINDNFKESVNAIGLEAESIYPLELTADRFTALIKLSAAEVLHTKTLHQNLFKQIDKHNTATQPLSYENTFDKWLGVEAFVLQGECRIDEETYNQGSYIRLPVLQQNCLTAKTDCILFIKLNQFLHGDTGIRTINTTTPGKWLPGPVDGIEIRPLHVFDTESIMLLRWQHAAEFRPKLNPRGEEILVISGLLQNRDHLYKQYSWIRNPIEDWRKWHGNTGTLIYYKSGHFPDDPTRVNNISLD